MNKVMVTMFEVFLVLTLNHWFHNRHMRDMRDIRPKSVKVRKASVFKKSCFDSETN